MSEWIKVLRTGSFTDRHGVPVIITTDRIDNIVKKYNPELSETPLVIGHPKNDDPAFGWVDSFKRAGEFLLAKPKQVVQEFSEAVNAGRYKYVSCALRDDDTVRHVGFLGAEPPAVKGLGSVSLSEGESFTEIELSEYNVWMEKSILRQMTGMFARLRDLFVEKYGADTADKITTFDDLSNIQRNIDNLEETPTNDVQMFSENKTGDSIVSKAVEKEGQNADQSAKVAELSEEITRLKTEAAARDKTIADAAKAATTREFGEFCNVLVTKGVLTPAVKTIACELSEVLSGVTTDIELSEADGKTSKRSPVDHLKALLNSLPKAIELSEVATKGKVAPTAVDATNPEAISKAAKEFQLSEAKAGRVIGISTAVEHVLENK